MVPAIHKLFFTFYLFIHSLFYLVGWLVVLRIYVALAVFQPYRDLEAGDNLSLKSKWPGRESNSGPLCSATTRPPPLPLFFLVKMIPHWYTSEVKSIAIHILGGLKSIPHSSHTSVHIYLHNGSDPPPLVQRSYQNLEFLGRGAIPDDSMPFGQERRNKSPKRAKSLLINVGFLADLSDHFPTIYQNHLNLQMGGISQYCVYVHIMVVVIAYVHYHPPPPPPHSGFCPLTGTLFRTPPPQEMTVPLTEVWQCKLNPRRAMVFQIKTDSHASCAYLHKGANIAYICV